jgi:hypothetical protein
MTNGGSKAGFAFVVRAFRYDPTALIDETIPPTALDDTMVQFGNVVGALAAHEGFTDGKSVKNYDCEQSSSARFHYLTHLSRLPLTRARARASESPSKCWPCFILLDANLRTPVSS